MGTFLHISSDRHISRFERLKAVASAWCSGLEALKNEPLFPVSLDNLMMVGEEVQALIALGNRNEVIKGNTR